MDKSLTELVDLIGSGKLTRNRHYELFNESKVVRARASAARIDQIGSLLESAADASDVDIKAAPLSGGRLKLHLRLPKLKLTWEASLEAHEVNALKAWPGLRTIFEPLG